MADSWIWSWVWPDAASNAEELERKRDIILHVMDVKRLEDKINWLQAEI